ncbi:hypothetical protein [Emticicia sp. 21SJ11W-3]|uniref:hypothetical protein n=1 Tax=Emticicia sp. 21SJ11W-3 TaxID=2916755 RepID=UPI00209FD1F9|nr:hypothetical protein [Emticicia sp. 21SJ11W-3]UTA70240.1 hypothetical protein MB380_10535 [Emticicia sp. 21SJ11W-3]
MNHKIIASQFFKAQSRLKFMTGLKAIMLVLATFLLATEAIQAQSVKRIEIPVGGGDDNKLQVISLGDEGLVVLSKTSKKTFSITKFDTDLQLGWSLNGDLEENQNFVDYYRDGRDVYLLFSKYNSDLYQIIKVSTGIGIMQKFFFENITRFEVSEFKVHNDFAYLAGMVKDEPVLMSVNLHKLQPRILAGGLKGTASISSLDFDDENNLLVVSYSVKKGRSSYMVVKRINQNGKIVEHLSVEPEEDYGLLTGKLFSLNDGTQLMIGNYGFRGYQSNGVPMSQGLYISKVDEDNTEYLKLHSFTEFRNFFKFMSQKQQDRIERQINKKRDKGSDLRLNYRVLVHDIIQKDDQYILVAEVFYPEFRNNNTFYGSPMYGNPFWSPYGYGMGGYRYFGMNSWAWNPWLWSGNRGFNNQQFDGFKYTHAVVAGFDKKGNLIWDNSFSFDNLKTYELKEKVKIKTDNNEITLVYSNKGKLSTKIVRGNDVVEGNKIIEIETAREGDKVRDTSTDDIEYWHQNYYLAWGYQKISNKNDGSRRVFYLNKIAF